MFLYAYTPTTDEAILVEQIHQKIDELAVQDSESIAPLHEQITAIREAKLKLDSYPERKLFILNDLQQYLFENYIDIDQWMDFTSDGSLHKFISKGVWFQNQYYIPADLVMLFPTPSLSLAVSNELSYMMISERALPWLQELATEFESTFGYPMLINSAWRSFEFQRDEFTQECRDSWLCAEAWYSEHQGGLSVDINGMFGEPYVWMAENAHRYGFHQSYQNGSEIDGYGVERWHWRFLWVEFATELHQAWITFTQYIRFQETWSYNPETQEEVNWL